MNTLEAIARRKSTRSYTSVQIPDEALEKIIKAGCAAPVARAQYDSLHITVIQNEEILSKIAESASEIVFKMMGVRKNMDFGAKTMIIVSSSSSAMPGMDYANAGIVLENMVLAATDLGIDSCIMGAPTAVIAGNEELSRASGIPEGFKPLLGAVFGYATEDAPAKEHLISVNKVI